MASTGPLTGKIFSNRYELGERIGVGGMAEVYSAQDLVLGRIVAVKTMLPQYAADPDFTRRFRQEAAAAANLQSPYIVNVYDWGHSGDNYYIVMEYVRGSDLKSAIKERGAINERKVAEIASQVCQALTVAHQQDIVHRDIKPQNIMIQPDGNIKVMDFGIARAKNSTASRTETVLGTAHYTSPEQAQGKILTPSSDIYSLGVVMYEAVTGQVPFDGPDSISVALMQVQDTPVDPRAINPDISPEFAEIILTAMAKDPYERFATANDLRIALTDFLAGRPLNLAPLIAGSPVGVLQNGNTESSDGFTGARTSVIGRIENTDSTQVMPVSGLDKTKSYGAVKRGSQNTRSYSSRVSDTEESFLSKNKTALIAAIVAAIVIIAAACVFFMGGSGEKADVPNVVGMKSEAAITAIETAGFKVGKIENVPDDSVESGQVLRQTPIGGKQAAKGSSIDIFVSTGSEMLSVPDVMGLPESQAKQIFVTSGFSLGTVTEEYNDTVDSGVILSQDPKAGSQAAKGSAINIVKSKGKEEILIPDLRGLTVSAAQAKAKDAGFTASETSSEFSDSVEEGKVISQTPGSGSKAAKGTTISLVVSKGADPNDTVPNVVGSSESFAKSALTNAGFNVSVTTNSSTTVAKGNVISQSPAGDSSAKKGSTVTIEVSTGPSSGGQTTNTPATQTSTRN